MTTLTVLDIADLVVGGILVAASLGRWRTSSGALLAAAGGAWWLADLVPSMTFLHRGFLIHLVLSHPDGRPRGTAVRATVATGYAYAIAFPVARNDVASLGMAAAVAAVAVRRHTVTTGPARRSLAFALGAALCLAGALILGPISRLLGVGTAATVLATYDLLVVAVAVLVATDMLRLGSARRAVTGLVVDLGELTGSDVLRDRLAAGLGDPELVIGYWLPARAGYVDDAGRALELPAPGDRRTITPLEVDGQPVAVLIHDSAILGDPRLLAQVAAAAQWALGNVALRSQVRAQVERVEASSRRIVTAADAERARLEERLQRGAGLRLGRVEELVCSVDSGLEALVADVELARSELEELARGLHPRVLDEQGLAAALVELAGRCPMPVHVAAPSLALPATIATTVYFACSEALTNALKYADASTVRVRVSRDDGHVSLVVADDGVGGANPRRGTGLRGLADRVEALGGRLLVDSPVGGGTRVELTLPLYPDRERAGTLAP